MGSSQSSLATPIDKCYDSEGGRKSQKDTIPALKRSSVSVMVAEQIEELTASETMFQSSFKSITEVSDDDESSCVSSDSDWEDDDDDEWEERLRILEDARKLKQVAEYFLHPETSVTSTAAVTRCIFDRPSAPPQVSKEEAVEKAAILADAARLKQTAVDYQHPERPIVTTDTGARCYFSRPAAYRDDDTAEERQAVLRDIAALKQAARDYLHPELPVRGSVACARNFFTRPSAIKVDEDCDAVLNDVKQLKELAVAFMHPEKPVVSDDPACTGRNYFSRPSAGEFEDQEDVLAREEALEDARKLKEAARYFMHPEMPVRSSVGVTRCIFDRPSAPERLSEEESIEKTSILQEMALLKKSAVDYLHPEKPVQVDPLSGARCYFSRASALDQEEESLAEEREAVLNDMKQLKQCAVDFLHPQLPVQSNPSTCARNYFDRVTAPTTDESDERDIILAEAAALKKLAVDYLHPEKPVQTTDLLAFGRNYFTRPSAPEQEEDDERDAIMCDVKALKTLATDFMHPERPVVTTDPTVFGRNYFGRASADDTEDHDVADEAKHVLQDMAALKQAAKDFLHPELPVTSNPSACARNYFSRSSAHDVLDDESADERSRILEEAKALKKLAVDYLHPEKPVVTDDPTATGRNYFDRPSNHLHNQNVHTFEPHEDDLEHHHEHMDHFGMDDDFVFSEFRNEMAAPMEEHKPKIAAGSDVGSNLSRSPSSIMLFNEEYVE